MTPEQLREIRDSQPFVPFRIFLTDGKYFVILHRELLMISRYMVEVGVAATPASPILDRIVSSHRCTS